MIYIARWKVLLILVVILAGILYAAPNVMSAGQRAGLHPWLPRNNVNLGLDLQGGSYLLLQVDLPSVLKDRSDSIAQGARPDLRKGKIGYTQIGTLPEGGVRIALRDGADAAKVHDILHGVDRDLIVSDNGLAVEGRFGDVETKRLKDSAMDQSIEIVRRRVDETGTREPVIQRQGDDRIILELPGLGDPKRIEDLLGKTAKLTFQLVDTSGAGQNLPLHGQKGQTVPVQREALLTGDMLTDAQPGFDQNGRPDVNFQLNGVGAKRFCDVTRENTGKPFAIVLDREVVSAPNINEPICGGQAQITGGFSVQEVNDTALLLRAGALPAPLHVLEERSVGPSLGADSVAAGEHASLYGFIFVVVLVCLVYGLFGLFATVALVINMILLFALLSGLQATLTLPGIAGIVLTMGLAVDANVLIFERIKEELRGGRSVTAAIDGGFHHALSSIIDSNLTSLISAVILMSFGTGPIKGFAVTLLLGTITSLFSSILLTRLIVSLWFNWKRPKAIAV